jgi:lantibiotic modifying enzyme
MGFKVEPTAPPVENGCSAEIIDYIDRLRKLYSHCYQTASQQIENMPLGTPEVKDVATNLFIQTVRHFSL